MSAEVVDLDRLRVRRGVERALRVAPYDLERTRAMLKDVFADVVRRRIRVVLREEVERRGKGVR